MMKFTLEEEEIIRCYIHDNKKTVIRSMEKAIPHLHGTAKELVVHTKDKLEKTSNMEYELLFKQLL